MDKRCPTSFFLYRRNPAGSVTWELNVGQRFQPVSPCTEDRLEALSHFFFLNGRFMSDPSCDTARMNLNKDQFKKAVERGFALCADLKQDYPELRLYPVLSRFGSGSGQCELTTDPLVILVEFSKMLVVSQEVERLGQLLRTLKKKS